MLGLGMRVPSGEQVFHVVRQKNMKKKQKSKIPKGRRIISWTKQAFWWRPKSPTVRDLLNSHVLQSGIVYSTLRSELARTTFFTLFSQAFSDPLV